MLTVSLCSQNQLKNSYFRNVIRAQSKLPGEASFVGQLLSVSGCNGIFTHVARSLGIAQKQHLDLHSLPLQYVTSSAVWVHKLQYKPVVHTICCLPPLLAQASTAAACSNSSLHHDQLRVRLC